VAVEAVKLCRQGREGVEAGRWEVRGGSGKQPFWGAAVRGSHGGQVWMNDDGRVLGSIPQASIVR
jgi:hypothetical protein